MKKALCCAVCVILILALCCCGEPANKKMSDVSGNVQTPDSPEKVQTPDVSEKEEIKQTDVSYKNYSYEATTFKYGDKTYDVRENMDSINAITGIKPVGSKIIVECHVAPVAGVYCIFDTESEAFEKSIIGTNFIWHSNDVTTGVYCLGMDILSYDGEIIKTYDFQWPEFVENLEFTDNNTKLNVNILGENDKETKDVIDLK